MVAGQPFDENKIKDNLSMIRKKVFWYNNSLNMSNRARMSFDIRGWYCVLMDGIEEVYRLVTKTKQLKELISKFKLKIGGLDYMIPLSRGKGWISYGLFVKSKICMDPFTFPILLHFHYPLGVKNLFNFIQSFYYHIQK